MFTRNALSRRRMRGKLKSECSRLIVAFHGWTPSKRTLNDAKQTKKRKPSAAILTTCPRLTFSQIHQGRTVKKAAFIIFLVPPFNPVWLARFAANVILVSFT